MALTPGARVGPYEITATLGSGGMGDVYCAQDTRLDRLLALKLLPADYTSDPDRLRRFVLEAKAASALNHPNILTIYEVGQADGHQFIAAELVAGETLRQRMNRARLSTSMALDVAIQIGNALAAAHASSIVHRDIKPENIMLRPDGLVKVLDFGLAKLAERGSLADPNASTRAVAATSPGMVLGTASYMSPEQARGIDVDARTDIFSLGVVLYEMLSGRSPFERDTVSDSMAAILTFHPPPLASEVHGLPPALERVVAKALRKDREERYQGVRDLLVDLKDLKQEVETAARESAAELSAEVASAPRPKRKRKTSGPARAAKIARPKSGPRVQAGAQRRWRWPTIGAALLAAVAAVMSYAWLGSPRGAPLNARDAIVLADFVNATGDAVFDGALKQALAVALDQSPFLTIVSDERVEDTLRLMGQAPGERVTRAIAREICQRAGLKALIAGSISSLGSHYVIALEAVNGQTGDVIAREQAEAAGKEQVLTAVGSAASHLRGKLGESLASIQQSDAPLEAVTTRSIEALQIFSSAIALFARGQRLEAIPLIKRAIELDPNFTAAYRMLAAGYASTFQKAAAIEAARRAFALRERTSGRERLRIEGIYYDAVTGEREKAIEVRGLYGRTYPEDAGEHNNLVYSYNAVGRFEKGIEEADAVIRLQSKMVYAYQNKARALVRLNRFDEAKASIQDARAQQLDTTGFLAMLYEIASAETDPIALKHQIDAAAGRPDAFLAFGWQAQSAEFFGRRRAAQELRHQAVGPADRGDIADSVAQWEVTSATDAAVGGLCREARPVAARARQRALDQDALHDVGLVFAMCGDAAETSGRRR